MWKPVGRTPAKELYKTLEKNQSTVRQVVLILFGAGINFTVGYGVMLSSLSAMVAHPTQTLNSTGLPEQTAVLSASYFAIGLIYSVVASLAFKPKRIVQPLYVQAVTASFVAILIGVIASEQFTTLSLSSLAFELFAIFLIALTFFEMAGLGQTLALRYLVGLNGDKDDTNSSTFVAKAKLDDVLRVFRKQEIYRAFDLLFERSRKGEFTVFRKGIAGVPEQFYLLVMRDPTDENKTQVAMVSYVLSYYGISRGEGSILDDMRVSEVKKLLRVEGIECEESNALEALAKAYEYALMPTQAKVLQYRSLSPHLKAITGGILAMFGIMTGLWHFSYIGADLYETFLLFAGLSLLFEFVPLFGSKEAETS